MNDSHPTMLEIRMFVAAYEERSFTAAALRENATQPGVSQHVRRLEEYLGTQLFIRQKIIVPTDAGTVYYHRCLDVLNTARDNMLALKQFTSGLSGELTVGVMPVMAHGQVAPTFLRMTEMHPNASIRIIEGSSSALVNGVAAEEIDFSVVPVADAKAWSLACSPLFNAPLYLLSSSEKDGDFSAISLADLKQAKLVVPDIGDQRFAITNYLAELACQPRIRHMNTVLGMLDLVHRSDWMAVVPKPFLAREFDGVERPRKFIARRIKDPDFTLKFAVVHCVTKNISPLGYEFLSILKTILSEQYLIIDKNVENI